MRLLGLADGDQTTDGDAFNISLERLRNNIGYVRDNVVLICCFLQFTGTYDMQRKGTRAIIFYDPNTDTYMFDEKSFALNCDENDGRATPRAPRDPEKLFDVDGKLMSKICTACHARKGSTAFSEGQSWCKPCVVQRGVDRRNTTRGFIKRMIAAARTRSSVRGTKRKRNDSSGEFADNLEALVVAMIVKQQGRCATTGAPFVYRGGHPRAPSIDRLINQMGYVDGNFQIIAAPLNTRNKPSNAVFAKIRADHFATHK